MIISKNDLIFGHPATQWKKVFKAGKAGEHKAERWISIIKKFIDDTESEARELFNKALKEDYFQQTDSNNEGTRFYCCGLTGAAIANAHIGKRIKWSEAKEIYEKFLERVQHVLEDDFFHYFVEILVLFGSFLTEKEEVSDIELTLTL
jgi:hypothetical protein